MRSTKSTDDLLVGSTLERASDQRYGASSTSELTAAILTAIWNRRVFLYRQTRLALLIGLLVVLLIPNSYESTTRLMPPSSDHSSQLAMLSTLASGSNPLLGAAAEMFGQKGTGELFIGILQSDLLRNRIVDRFDLKNVYSVRFEGDARKKLSDHTVITEDRKSGIITLAVTDHNQERAQQIASAYVDELNRLVAQLSTSAARREREFLAERLSDVKQELDRSTAALAKYSSTNNAINIPEQARAMLTAAATLQGEKIAAESELKGLEQIYAPTNVRIRSLQARIAELNAQLNRMGGDASAGTDSSDKQHDIYPSIRELPNLGAGYAKLYRDTRTEETVYETLTVQYELAKVEEAKEIPTVRVLDPPEFPEKRSGPRRTLLVLAIIATWLTLTWGASFALNTYREASPDNSLKKIVGRIRADVGSPYSMRFGRMSSSMYRRLMGPALPSEVRQEDEPRDSDRNL